jgi:hypothetical protein
VADRDDIVKVRLSGTGISRLADAIAESGDWAVLDRSRPYPNRREPGERIYLTVRYEPGTAPAAKTDLQAATEGD